MKSAARTLRIAFLALTMLATLGNAAFAERQEHMHGALKHLRAAHAQLAAATHDKGGHRTAAISLIEQAIKQIEDGIKFDNTHDSGKKENRH